MNGPNWYHWLQSYEKKIILTHFSPKSFCFSINMNKKRLQALMVCSLCGKDAFFRICLARIDVDNKYFLFSYLVIYAILVYK